MSYSPEYLWNAEIMRGVSDTLGEKCDLTFFHLDTKRNPDDGPAKAKQAYELFTRLQPDGVIAADDNAQAMFVRPYLAGRVLTPVVFCGVNEAPSKYGYPTANVTGILERAHLKESVAFARELVPGIRNMCLMTRKTVTGVGIRREVEDQAPHLSVNIAGFALPGSYEEAREAAIDFRNRCDLLFLDTMEGIRDATGRPRSDAQVMPAVMELFNGPTITSNEYAVHYGVLAAVVKRGWEQGALAAEKLLTIFDGVAVQNLPISRNMTGKRMINVTTMRSLGYRPSPEMLRGAELVKTAPAARP